MSEWQDIDTAPIDQDILVVCDNFGEKGRGIHFAVVRWDSEYGVFADANIDHDDDYDLDVNGAYQYATHWMPLPEPPEDNTNKVFKCYCGKTEIVGRIGCCKDPDCIPY